MPRGGMIAMALGLERGSAVARGSAVPAGDGGRLLDPGRQLRLVELVRLADIQGAHVLELADGRNGREPRPASSPCAVASVSPFRSS